MLISNPRRAKYSEKYRRSLFVHFQIFQNHNVLDALRINVQIFGRDIVEVIKSKSIGPTESA